MFPSHGNFSHTVFITLKLGKIWFVYARPGWAVVTACSVLSYKGLILLLVMETKTCPLLVRVVYGDNVDVLSMQIYMVMLKQLFVPPNGIVIRILHISHSLFFVLIHITPCRILKYLFALLFFFLCREMCVLWIAISVEQITACWPSSSSLSPQLMLEVNAVLDLSAEMLVWVVFTCVTQISMAVWVLSF